jgi:hypothetical protein
MLDRFVIASLPQAMNRRTCIGAERSDARSLRHRVIAARDNPHNRQEY